MGLIDGFRRGVKVIDIGGFIKVFVGRGILGRIFNVLGEFIDNKGEVVVLDYWFIYRSVLLFEE